MPRLHSFDGQRRNALGLGVAVLAAPSLLRAQPQVADGRPINLVVSYPPGGGADLIARLIAGPMGKALGQAIVVENRPGGSGQIAAGLVARAKADGSTLLLDASSFAVNPALFPALAYDSQRDFSPIGIVAKFPNVLVCNPGFEAKTVRDLVRMAKAAPGKIAYASSGNGSAQHLAGALFESRAGVQLVHVPYRGGGPALNDVIGGQVPLFFANVASSLGHIESGRLRPLAVTTSVRARALPQVPTMEQAGVPAYEVFEWNPLLVPSGTPPPVQEKLRAALQSAIGDPEVLARIRSLSGEPFAQSDPAQVAAFLRQQREQWGKLVRERHITAG